MPFGAEDALERCKFKKQTSFADKIILYFKVCSVILLKITTVFEVSISSPLMIMQQYENNWNGKIRFKTANNLVKKSRSERFE